MRWRSALGPALFAVALLLATGIGRGEPQDAEDKMAMPGVDECVDCHEDHVGSFRLNPHSALDSEGYAALAGVGSSCVACHGDATAHIDEGGGEGTIFAFHDSEPATTASELCLTCHDADHRQYQGSSHAQAGLACTDCHGIHGDPWSLLEAVDPLDSAHAATSTSDTCAGCHNEVFAQFEYNERHRLQEGVLECTSCHNPHEASNRWLLGGFKQESCVDCHVDKGGPFIFEHGSMIAEACTSCHTPHGSANRHMLTLQSVADLCYSCHGAVPGFHARFTNESQCTSCHSTIHGSHFDPYFLK